MFTKGQRLVNTDNSYKVLACHRDGTMTVRAMFPVDAEGNDRRCGYLGFTYRVPNEPVQSRHGTLSAA